MTALYRYIIALLFVFCFVNYNTVVKAQENGNGNRNRDVPSSPPPPSTDSPSPPPPPPPSDPVDDTPSPPPPPPPPSPPSPPSTTRVSPPPPPGTRSSPSGTAVPTTDPSLTGRNNNPPVERKPQPDSRFPLNTPGYIMFGVVGAFAVLVVAGLLLRNKNTSRRRRLNGTRMDEMFSMTNRSPPNSMFQPSNTMSPVPPMGHMSPAMRMNNYPSATAVPLSEAQYASYETVQPSRPSPLRRPTQESHQYSNQEDDEIANAWAAQMRSYQNVNPAKSGQRMPSPQQHMGYRDEEAYDETMLYGESDLSSMPRQAPYY